MLNPLNMYQVIMYAKVEVLQVVVVAVVVVVVVTDAVAAGAAATPLYSSLWVEHT